MLSVWISGGSVIGARSISPDLYEKVQTQLEKVRSDPKNQNRFGNRIYPLSGLLHMEDGSRFAGTSGTGRDGEGRYYYRNKKHQLSVDADAVERAVVEALHLYCRSDKKLEEAAQQLKDQKISQVDFLGQQEREIQKRLRVIEEEEEQLTKTVLGASGGGTPQAFALMESQLTKKKMVRADLKGHLASIEKERASLLAQDTEIKSVKTKVDRLLGRLSKATPLAKRNLYRSIFQKLELSGGNEIKFCWKFGDLGQKNTGDLVFPGEKWLSSNQPGNLKLPPLQVVGTIPFRYLPLHKDQTFLHQRYVIERRSIPQMTKECFSSQRTVRNHLIKAGLITPRKLGRPLQPIPKAVHQLAEKHLSQGCERRSLISLSRKLKGRGLGLKTIAKVLNQHQPRGFIHVHPETVKRWLNAPD